MKSIYLFGIVIVVIVFFGVFMLIKNSSHKITHANTTANTYATTTTNANKTVNIPPITPPVITPPATPTVNTPTPTVITPPATPTVNTPTPTVSKSFNIQSVATKLYYGDKGMTPNINNAIIFTENAAHNLTTNETEEWGLKYVELNGKAMLTNDSETAGYIINTPPASSGGPALENSPFIAISSVADALSPENSNTFQVVKVY